MSNSDFSSHQDTPGPDRRNATRYPCQPDRHFRLFIPQRDECWWARARDISTIGISFITTSPLEPGTVTYLRLQVHHDPTPLAVLGEVIHATPQPDGNWLIGCKLEGLCYLNEDDRLQIRELFLQDTDNPSETKYQLTIPKTLAGKLYCSFAPVY